MSGIETAVLHWNEAVFFLLCVIAVWMVLPMRDHFCELCGITLHEERKDGLCADCEQKESYG